MSEQNTNSQPIVQDEEKSAFWVNQHKDIQAEPEIPVENKMAEPSVAMVKNKKTSFGDGVNFGLFAFSVSGLIAMGSMGALAAPAGLVLFILFIYFAITKGWKFVLGYFLIGLVFLVVLVGGFFLLMSSV